MVLATRRMRRNIGSTLHTVSTHRVCQYKPFHLLKPHRLTQLHDLVIKCGWGEVGIWSELKIHDIRWGNLVEVHHTAYEHETGFETDTDALYLLTRSFCRRAAQRSLYGHSRGRGVCGWAPTVPSARIVNTIYPPPLAKT